MTIDPTRRNELTRKYGLRDSPDPTNTQILAMLDAPHVVAKSFSWRPGHDLGEMFDPSRCSQMHAVARRTHATLRTAMAAGQIDYAYTEGEPFDPDDADGTATLVHFVGLPSLIVVRRGAVDIFAAMYKATRQATVRRMAPTRCQVRIASVCDAACANGRALEFWPYLCGQFLIMFPICGSCRAKAFATAETNYTFAEIAARDQATEHPIPAWARTAPRWRRVWGPIRQAVRSTLGANAWTLRGRFDSRRQ